MNPDMAQAVPDPWKGLALLLLKPFEWLLPASSALLAWASNSDVWEVALGKRSLLLLPVLAVLAGLWCTTLAAYTMPFRSGRIRFVSTLLVLWWDIARSAWLFWLGLGRFVWLALGTMWGLVRLLVETTVEMIKEIVELPFVVTGTITRNLSQPGVPWLAFVLTIAWSALEGVVFTYVLAPTMGEVISDLTGADTHRFLGVFLFAMLCPMIAGSFACLHVLLDAVQRKDYTQIAQMVIVEFFVMFFEVMFLYRELIDALTPWIAQQTGLQMGIVPVLTLACFSWFGVRGMVWFLFARYGTPTLLALISRQRLPEEAAEAASASVSASEQRWERAVAKLKGEQAWFEEKARALVEAAILPCFQLIAAALNFCFVLFLSRPLFSLPFKTLAEIGETTVLLRSLHVLEGSHENVL